MEKVKVPVAKIRTPSVRVTAVYTPELQEILRSTISKMGILNPIIVTRTGDDYFIVDGLHRVEEARVAGAEFVEAIVYEGPAEDNLLMNLVLNHVRGKTRASEMVTVIEELVKTYKLDSEEIAKRTGLTRDYVEKLWKISETAPGVREALDAEIITVSSAFEIARLPSHEQQEYMVSMQGIWKMPVKDLHTYVDQVLQMMKAPKVEAKPFTPPPPQLPRCDACQKETNPKYLHAVVMCPTCFGTVWQAIRSAAAQPADSAASQE